jgi:transcriptional regulator of acetoin/glycerol metabolism
MSAAGLYHRQVEAKRHDLLTTALRVTKGNVARAARILELQRTYYYRMLRARGIDPRAFR